MSARSGFGGRDLWLGAAAGGVFGFIVRDLDLTSVVSYWGEQSYFVPAGAALGAAIARTSLKSWFKPIALAAAVLWLSVAFTPLTHFMAAGLVRSDPPEKADAVFVLASGLQVDGDFTPKSLGRLVGGLELLGRDLAPRLIVAEPRPRYADSVKALMARLGLEREILIVGPVRSTRDEARAVAELCRRRGYERLLVVTSPSHSRRASGALEAQGIRVISVPSREIEFDFENLDAPVAGDQHVRAFGELLHEHLGFQYYRLRGWVE